MCQVLQVTYNRLLHVLQILEIVGYFIYGCKSTDAHKIYPHTVPQENYRLITNKLHAKLNPWTELQLTTLPGNITSKILINVDKSENDASNSTKFLLTFDDVHSHLAVNLSKIVKRDNEVSTKQLSKPAINKEYSTIHQKNIPTYTMYASGHSVPIPEKCPNFGQHMKLVVLILSDPMHYLARKAIRQTWGLFGHRKDVNVLFMLGVTTDTYLEKKLKYEQNMHVDIIRGNFLDTYSNLTLKTISILEWVDKYCSQAAFVLKTDDDVFINMPRLITFVRIHIRDKNVIFGRVSDNNKPHRDKDNKYYVSRLNYKQEVYPPFLTGPAYLLSNDIIHRLYVEALNTAFLKLEDVFITGIVANKLGIERVDAIEFVNQRESFSLCELQGSISLHSIKYSEQYDLWEKLFICNPSCPSFCLYRSQETITLINNFLLFILSWGIQIL